MHDFVALESIVRKSLKYTISGLVWETVGTLLIIDLLFDLVAPKGAVFVK